MRSLSELEAELRSRVALGISLEPLGAGRYAVLTPFTFDDGDRFPIVLVQRDGGWRISDEGASIMHLSYDDYAIDEGNRVRLIENIAKRHGLEIVDWTVGRSTSEVPDAEDILDFVHALARISDVGDFLARDVVASTFAEDFREFLRETVSPQAVTFDYHDSERDPEGNYRIDAALARNGSPPIFTFAVSSDSRAKDATIALLTFEHWGVPFTSIAVSENQADLGRRPLAQLTDVVEKQFASLRGNEERIRGYLSDRGVPLQAAAL